MAKKQQPKVDPSTGPALHSARWRFGDFELDEGKRELTRYGKVLELEPKPLNMLMLMLRHPGELITKSDLMEALWTGRIVTESVVSNCAAKLRGVLGDDNADVRLRTLHGYGYRLEANPTLVTAEAPQPVEATEFSAEQPVPFRQNWRLKRRLGASGETWLGEHTATGEQRVFKFALSPRGLSALKREVTLYRLLRQSLLDAAPIVELLDWNFDEPPWFIEAEYCALGSLAEYLEQCGGAKALPLPKRLDIVVQIAEALAKVHALGILHKDLKPANILMSPSHDGRPRVHLGDFGAGRLIDLNKLEALAITRLGFTQFTESSGGGGSSSTSAGTPLYYAPEVLSGQPATLKADIYALGVILYQLVAGDMRRLFAPGWELSVDDELLREDIAKAAAGNPAERMGDAQLLGDRLRRLEERRKLATAESQERALAAALKHKLAQAQARRKGYQAAAIALGLGLALSVWMYLRAEAARATADEAAARATAVTDFFLKDMIADVIGEDRPAQAVTVKDLLDSAAMAAPLRLKQQPEVVAMVHGHLAHAYSQLDIDPAATRQYQLAFDGYAKSLGETSLPALKTAAALLHAEYLGGLLPQRAAFFQKLADAAVEQYGASHSVVFDLRSALALSDYLMGRWQKSYDRMLALDATAPKGTQDDRRQIYRNLMCRIYALVSLERYDEAEGLLRLAREQIQKEYGTNHYEHARVDLKRAEIFIGRRDFAAAKQAIDGAQPIIQQWEKLPGSFAGLTQMLRFNMAFAQQNLLAMRSLLAEAEADYLRTKGEQMVDDDVLLKQRALLALMDGHPEIAVRAFQQALQLSKQFRSEQHPDRIDFLQWLAHSELAMSKQNAAQMTLSSVDLAVLQSLPNTHGLRARQLVLLNAVRTGVTPPL